MTRRSSELDQGADRADPVGVEDPKRNPSPARAEKAGTPSSRIAGPHQRRGLAPVAAVFNTGRLMASDATAHLIDLSAACRRAADPYLVASDEAQRAVGDELMAWPGIGRSVADNAAIAVHLQQAADHLARAAQDPRVAAVFAHLEAGGDVVLVTAALPRPVVVSQDQHAALTAPADGLAVRVRRALRRIRGAA